MKNNNQNEMPRFCMYCEHSTLINDKDNVLCDKKGIVNAEYCCKRYFYDPLKRVPRIPKKIKEEEMPQI